jgi:hypothetical protein
VIFEAHGLVLRKTYNSASPPTTPRYYSSHLAKMTNKCEFTSINVLHPLRMQMLKLEINVCEKIPIGIFVEIYIYIFN